MLDERYLWLSAFIEHPKFNLDTRTATNSYLTKVYNILKICIGLQEVYLESNKKGRTMSGPFLIMRRNFIQASSTATA